MTPEPSPGTPPVDVATAPWPTTTVLGPGAVLEVCARAAVILLAGAVVLYGGYLALEQPTSDDLVDAESFAVIVALMYGMHLAALLALGWPGGMLTARLMRRHPSEWRHVAAFAATGAVLGAAVLLVAGFPGTGMAVWAAVGAVSAGGARAWTGRARRRRAVRQATHLAAT
ncbi:hypothetical protein [Cellulomonas xiejunii]|uniref:Integral membrane protein n=1 Tax=Cellulomonas xiejunii TaxID=2968083 RepID=A0ABY5KU83_9CELL|nr:hypothetical protein [Cellulomonas xiejunii]MCC2315152.1 hypothetical protein [Cellulomonas xiejunii]MCC2321706.1 hypothetical protein [Cellulomonas xiejunii]UUI73016.1 hypothetical protein NP048_06130 [Cellulomonas xiejunii]